MVISGLRKNIKQNPKKEAIHKNPPRLSGAIFVFGRIKSGKTAAMLAFAQIYHDHPSRQYKIWDVWGGSRNEHLYWTLPSDKKEYWDRAKKILNLNRVGRKQYKVNLLYPITKKLHDRFKAKDKALPNNPPNVKSQAFTIPINDVSTDDIELLVGTLSPNIASTWNNMIFEHGKKITPAKVFHELNENHSHTVLYRSLAYPLIKQHNLLQSPHDPLNLKVSEEMADQETISVLCLDFVEPEHRLFVMGYVMRKITEELDRKKYRKQILLMREASDFFRVTEQSSVPERTKVFKSKLSEWIRMGRRGFHMLLDTQSPSETKGLVSGQEDLTILGRLPNQRDREEATTQRMRDGLINKNQVIKLGKLNPGEFIVCPSGKHAYEEYFLLPKTRFWEEGNSNFYETIWKNTVNRWTNFKEEVSELIEKFNNELKEIKEEEKRKKEEAERKKQEEKEKKKKEKEVKKQKEKEKKQEEKEKKKEKERKEEEKLEKQKEKIKERRERIKANPPKINGSNPDLNVPDIF